MGRPAIGQLPGWGLDGKEAIFVDEVEMTRILHLGIDLSRA